MSCPDLVIVLCAGNGDRWQNYLDRPKHLVVVDGELILHRTVKLLRRLTTHVWVVAPDDDRFRDPLWHTLTITPAPIDADKFWSSRQLWRHHPGHTLFVMGDAWYSDQAVEWMCADYDQWRAFCRPGPSRVSPYGELFGFSIPSDDLGWFTDRLLYIAGANALGEIPVSNGWALYRAMCEQPLGEHVVTTNAVMFTEDMAEDFDTPIDYDLFTGYRG